MHTDPAPLSEDGGDLPLIPGPAVSRPSLPRPTPESSVHDLIPPFVSPRHRDENRVSVHIDVGGDLELRESDDAPAPEEDTDVEPVSSEGAETADGSPHSPEPATGIPGGHQVGSDDLAWLSAIDWGDDKRPAAEAVAEEPQADSVDESAEATLAPIVEGDLESAEPDSGPAADLTEVVVEELVGAADPAPEPPGGVPAWMSWVNDDADPVDPDPSEQAASDDELPVVEIESLLAEEQDEPLDEPEDSAVDLPVWGQETDRTSQAPSWSAEVEDRTDVDEIEQAEVEVWASDARADAAEVAETPELAEVVEAEGEGTIGSFEEAPVTARIGKAAAVDDSLEELAGKLERLARALRSGSLSEVIAGASSSDPLEVLLAGYALGYSRSREPARDQAD